MTNLSFEWNRPDTFEWDRPNTPFRHYLFPMLTPVVFSILCALANAHLLHRGRKPVAPSLLRPVAALHNALLVLFSASCVAGISYDLYTRIGPKRDTPTLALFLFELFCPQQFGQPLKGRVFWWCYIFYVSKYWELLDTALLVLKGKRVRSLHIWHHTIVPPVMWAAFQGRLAPALIFTVLINGLVHTLMYAYFFLTSCGVAVPKRVKKMVTHVQILQFWVGVLGGGTFLALWLRTTRVHSNPFSVEFIPGCSGDLVVFGAGFLVNLSFLVLFQHFFSQTYRPKKDA